MRHKIDFTIQLSSLPYHRMSESTFSAVQAQGYAEAIGCTVLKVAPFEKDNTHPHPMEAKYSCDFVVFKTSDWNDFREKLIETGNPDVHRILTALEWKHLTDKLP